MKFFITGISGLIGSSLTARLIEQGHEVAGLTRDVAKASAKLPRGTQLYSSFSEIDDFIPEIVINLSGEPIADKRWTDARKRELISSRVGVTNALVEWLSDLARAPELFISGSAIGFYGRQQDAWIDEQSVPHMEFTHELCSAWENAARAIEGIPRLAKTRLCWLRTGVVLSDHDGFLGKLKLPFSLGLGGRLGSGEQFLSWIHLDDMVRGIEFLVEHQDCAGPYNFTAPNPVTNKVFTHSMSRALHRPAFFHAPGFALKMMLGELSDLLLTGQRVKPKKLLDAGFSFKYEELDAALEQALHPKG